MTKTKGHCVTKTNPWMTEHPENTFGRDFVVGDVHGCLDELLNLLGFVFFNPLRDRLFCVGDIVDRGSASRRCLDLLWEPWFFSARGNHEEMLLTHLKAPSSNEPFEAAWVDQMGEDESALLVSKIESVPNVIRVNAKKPFWIVHAELWNDAEKISEQDIFDGDGAILNAREKSLWSRAVISSHLKSEIVDPPFESDVSRIYCGHTIVQYPVKIGPAIYLDTGAFVPAFDPTYSRTEYFGLSMIEVETERLFFAPTCEQYRGATINLGNVSQYFQSNASGR